MARSPPPRPARQSCQSCPRENTQHRRGGETQAKEAPSPQRRGPPWSQSGEGPLASAEGALVTRKRRRPPRLGGGSRGGHQIHGGPRPSAAGASVGPKSSRPPRLSSGGLGDPKAKEAPLPQRRGPRCSQSDGGPLASAEGASVDKKRRRPLATAEGASVIPKRRRHLRLSGGGLDGFKAKEAPSPQWRGPR